jgi:hypothetical protein
MEQPKVLLIDEAGKELVPKEIKIEEDSEGIFLITVTVDNADLVGWRTFGT